MRVSSHLRAMIGAVALIILGAGPLAHAGEARDLLARMAETMRTGAYEGTFVYQRADDLQTMSLAHAVIGGVEHERLRTLSGEPFEVVRAGDQVTCVWPQASEALVARRPEELLPSRPVADLDELPPMYTAEIVGRERIAGRDTDVIVIRPRDQQRYGYRMWLGRDEHLLLRSDLVSPDGTTLERMLFTRMETHKALRSRHFKPEIDEGDYAEHYTTGSDDDVLDSPVWLVGELPAGFKAVSHRMRTMADGGPPVQHSVYSDGLASVSVFVEPAVSETPALQGLTYMGAVNAFGRRVGDHQVTVVGELPAATVRAIAGSVSRRDAG